jgi:ribosomal protein S18 acetylase RimI-like enzyme
MRLPSDADIRIRPACLEDAETIQSMIAALARETVGSRQSVISVDAVRRYAFGPEKAVEPIVAERGGAVVAAMILFDEFSTWRGMKGVHVLDIYILPDARGSGLGRRLISEAARWGRARGAGYVKLSVDEHNLKAVNFYEAIGFVESAHDRTFILSGDAFQAIGDA